MERVMKELGDGSVGLIGVHGMGGVGKSFLMKKVLLSAKKDGLFNEVVFAVVSQDVNLKMIQQQIADQLGLSKVKDTPTESARAAIIRERLTNLNSKGGVLIVVDDVWDEYLDLSLVGIPIGTGSSSSCKVVITTRDRRVCTGMGCDKIIELKTLSEDESWDLFSKTAGVVDDDSEDPQVIELARAAAEKCDGLPLALTVMGKTMRASNRRADEWASVVEELEQLRPINMEGVRERLYKVVKVSFDRLRSEEERLCFLFLCLFPEDYSVSLNHHYNPNGLPGPFEILLPTYTWYAVGEGFLEDKDVHTLADAQKRVGKILVRLKDCGLLINGDIKDEDGEEYYESVKMHDVVRHVALQIAAGDGYGLYSKAGVALQQWPIISNLNKIQRISLISARCKNEDDYYYHLGLVPNDMDCPRLRTLTLAEDRILKDIPDGFFLGMKALQVLDLTDAGFSSFPSSLSCLTNLRVLFLSRPRYVGDGYNDTDLLLVSSLTNLEILSIRGGREGSLLFPTEMRNLTKLRCLDLRRCEGLIMPPNVLSKLSNLEQLYITDSFEQWQVQQDTDRAAFVELAHLRRLTHLYVNVKNKQCLWQEFDSVDPWPNLTEFHIEVGYNPSGIIKPATSTRAELWLKGGNYNALLLPGWLKRLMTRTKQLALLDWGTFEIPASNFSLVENLIIKGTSNPSMLFNAGGSFTNLKWLQVSHCCNITSIFASDHTLLPQVECIMLKALPQLIRICEEGDLRCPNMTELTVQKCNSLTHILGCQRDGVLCPNLRELIVGKCDSLMAIIATSVEELEEEEEATLLQQQDNTFMPRHQKLTLTNLPLLTKFHQAGNIYNNRTPTVYIPSLQVIVLSGLPQLTRICQEGDLRCPNLTWLAVYHCDSLTNIFSQRDRVLCPNLKKLDVEECNSLTHIFPSVRQFPCLEGLSLKNCGALTAIIATSVEEEEEEEEEEATLLQQQDNTFTPRLQKLTLKRLPLLTKFHHAGNINNNSTPPVFIPSLHELSVEDCPQLEAIHLRPESLTNISIINSSNLYNSLSSSDFFSKAPLLEYLGLGRIEELYEIFFGKGVHAPPMLPALTKMRLHSLPQLICICAGGDIPYESFQNMDPNCQLGLEVLEVYSCDLLTSIFSKRQAGQSLPQLKRLNIESCAAFKELIMITKEEDEKAAGIIVLPQLEILTITGCPNLEKVHGLLPSLEMLRVENCCNITSIFASDTLLPKVERIVLEALPQLTRICQEGDLRCPNLTLLDVRDCNSLTHILWCQRDDVLCPNLRELNVTGCNSLTHIFPSWRQFRCLEQLSLRDCGALTAIIIATSVEELEEEDEATMLQHQDNSFLPRLQYLTLKSLPLLTKFHQACNINNNSTPPVFFPSLRMINVTDCPQLEAQHLNISGLRV